MVVQFRRCLPSRKVLGDGLRASVMEYMIESIQELGDLLGPNSTEVLNADVPDDIQFGSLEESFRHMSNATASVGELKVVSTAGVLQRTIVVVDQQFVVDQQYQRINVYEPEEAVSSAQGKADKGTLALQLTKLGINIGRYRIWTLQFRVSSRHLLHQHKSARHPSSANQISDCFRVKEQMPAG